MTEEETKPAIPAPEPEADSALVQTESIIEASSAETAESMQDQSAFEPKEADHTGASEDAGSEAESDGASEADAFEAEAPSQGLDLIDDALPEPAESAVSSEQPASNESSADPEQKNPAESAEPVQEMKDTADKSTGSDSQGRAEASQERVKISTIVGILAILLVVISVIYVAAKQIGAPERSGNGQKVVVSDRPEAGKVSIIEEATADDIGVLVNSGKTVWPKTDIFAFFGNSQKNPDGNDCTQVYAVKRSVEKKYDSNMMNTISGLLQPISAAEKEAGYFSAIPAGATLKYLKLDDTGIIEANFSGAIKNAAGSCAVTAIRSQIKSTLMQFSAVKSVVICVDGECDDGKILQP